MCSFFLNYHVSSIVLSYISSLSSYRSSNLQQQAQTASTPSFIAALVLNAAVFGAELLAFSLLRKRFKTIYEPRTFLTPKKYVSVTFCSH